MEISNLKVDSQAKEQGSWQTPPGYPDLSFLTRSTSNADYRRVYEKRIMAAMKGLRRGENVPPDVRDAIRRDCILEHCLLDWKGLTQGGVELPYSKDTAKELLADPDYKLLLDLVEFCADTVGEINEELLGDTAGNSAAPSVTSSQQPATGTSGAQS